MAKDFLHHVALLSASRRRKLGGASSRYREHSFLWIWDLGEVHYKKLGKLGSLEYIKKNLIASSLKTGRKF